MTESQRKVFEAYTQYEIESGLAWPRWSSSRTYLLLCHPQFNLIMVKRARMPDEDVFFVYVARRAGKRFKAERFNSEETATANYMGRLAKAQSRLSSAKASR